MAPKLSEPMGAPSLFFIEATAKPDTANEISYMVWLVNEAFYRLVVYNLDIFKTYDQVFNLFCLRKIYLALEGELENYRQDAS